MRKLLLLSALFLAAVLIPAPSADAQNSLCRVKCIDGACNFGHDDGYMGDCETVPNPEGTGTFCQSTAPDPCTEPPGGGGGGHQHFEEDETDGGGNGTQVIVLCWGGCPPICTFCG